MRKSSGKGFTRRAEAWRILPRCLRGRSALRRRLTDGAGRPRMSWRPRKGERFFGILSEGEERERVEAREPLSIRNERQKEAGFVGERQERLLSQ